MSRAEVARAEGSPDLSAALAALCADNLVLALDRLLDAWNQHRAAETAGLIERLGAVIDRSLDPVVRKGLSPKALEDRWIDIAGQRRPADVGRLMEAVGAVSARAMKVFFTELADFKPDPRMPWPAIAAASRFSSTGAGPTRTAAFKLAAGVADGRIGHQPRDLTPEGVEGWAVRKWKAEVKDRIARLKESLPPPPALGKNDRALLAAIRTELGRLAKAPPRDEAALFADASPAKASGDVTAESLVAAILADPGDVDRRLVYADWLVERQDPRGELIILQQKERQTGKLTAKEKQRIKALISTHGAAWIRPLDAVVKKPTFALGFLSGCSEIRFRTKQQRAELLEHPLWATVEEIDACNEERLLLGGGLRSLKVLSADAPVLARLAARPTPAPIEEVRTAISKATVDLWEEIGKVGALTRLTRLRLQPEDFGTFERTEQELPRGGRLIHDS